MDHAIKLQPNYTDAYNERGINYAALNQNQRAVADFNEVIRLKPYDAKAYQNRGIAYTGLLQYQSAIEDFNKVISLKHDNVDAYNCRGYVYFKQGNKKLGCIDAKKACALGNCKLSELTKNKRYCH